MFKLRWQEEIKFKLTGQLLSKLFSKTDGKTFQLNQKIEIHIFHFYLLNWSKIYEQLFLYLLNYPPASETKRKIENFIKRKITCPPLYNVKDLSVCLSVCKALWPHLSYGWLNRMVENNLGHLCIKVLPQLVLLIKGQGRGPKNPSCLNISAHWS